MTVRRIVVNLPTMIHAVLPACPEHAPQIADLIIVAMTPDCCLHFVGPDHTLDDFRLIMQQLVAMDHSQYSYRNTLLCLHGSLVTGICVCYDGALLHTLRRPFIDAMRSRCGRDLSRMDDETAPGELYIDSLAVLPAYRRQGMATALLNAAAQRARDLSIPRVGLLVDQANPAGQRLYARNGFRNVGETLWGGHPMYHLQRTILPA